jgi:hypothetical protein
MAREPCRKQELKETLLRYIVHVTVPRLLYLLTPIVDNMLINR